MKLGLALVKWLARTLAVLLLVIVGSTALVRFAPGYLSDEREMDARYAVAAQADIANEAARSHSLAQMLSAEIGGWLRGNGGISRQYGVPVSELILPRLAVTGELRLQSALILAWAIAVLRVARLQCGAQPWLLWQAPATFLLAIPTAAMATLCLLTNHGGPILVMALLLAARDFKFLHRMLRKAWLDPHVLHARALGIPTRQAAAHARPARNRSANWRSRIRSQF